MPYLTFTSREQLLFTVLATQLRALSLKQIAAAGWRGDQSNARRRLAHWVALGYCIESSILARSREDILLMTSWQPNQSLPDPGPISYQLRKRWSQLPAQAVRCYRASAKAKAVFGGYGSDHLCRPIQASHDLALAQCWLHYYQTSPEVLRCWRGEDFFAASQRGEKCPDAMLFDGAGRPYRVIECAGGYGYDAPRLLSFMRYCASHNPPLPFEIWG